MKDTENPGDQRYAARDPQLAQQLEQYFRRTNGKHESKESLASDQEFVEQALTQVADAQRHLEEVQQRWNSLAVSQPIESLQSEIDAALDLESKVQEQLVEAQAQSAEYRAAACPGCPVRPRTIAGIARESGASRKTGAAFTT